MTKTIAQLDAEIGRLHLEKAALTAKEMGESITTEPPKGGYVYDYVQASDTQKRGMYVASGTIQVEKVGDVFESYGNEGMSKDMFKQSIYHNLKVVGPDSFESVIVPDAADPSMGMDIWGKLVATETELHLYTVADTKVDPICYFRGDRQQVNVLGRTLPRNMPGQLVDSYHNGTPIDQKWSYYDGMMGYEYVIIGVNGRKNS